MVSQIQYTPSLAGFRLATQWGKTASSACSFCDNAPMTTVGDLGETALIERITERVRRASPLQTMGGRIITGIGDDAAVWRVGGVQAATTDTMVEGVHFRSSTMSWADVGWKAWASNVSDIAAMGGVPVAGLVTLGLPAELDVSDIDALYDGMLEACASYGTELMGGDIVGSPVAFVTVAMTGVCSATPLTRSAARPGDVARRNRPARCVPRRAVAAGGRRRAGHSRAPGARTGASQTQSPDGCQRRATASRRAVRNGPVGRARGRSAETGKSVKRRRTGRHGRGPGG